MCFRTVRIQAVYHSNSSLSGANLTSCLLLSAEALVLQVNEGCALLQYLCVLYHSVPPWNPHGAPWGLL